MSAVFAKHLKRATALLEGGGNVIGHSPGLAMVGSCDADKGVPDTHTHPTTYSLGQATLP